MLIYVIPFVLLLVVAIVLKKREAGKEADQAPKKTAAAARTKAKTPANKRKAPQKTQVIEDPVIEKKQETPLSDELRTQIQGLIRDRNYFAAEAQINQALNKDNSQHELYLLLLDIHLQQKDEFAISQLFNHLRSLELEDTLIQAEQKKTEYEKENLSSVDTIEFQPQTSSSTKIESAPTLNTQDFDALINDKATTSNSFDLLQAETTQPAAVEEKPLEFKSFSLNPEALETKTEATQNVEAAPLKFDDLELNPQAKDNVALQPENEPLVTELKDLEFSFNLDPAPTVESAPEPVAAPAEDTVEEKPEFKFSFDLEQSPPPTETTTQIEEEAALPALSFDLDPQASDRAATPSIPVDNAEPATSVTAVAQEEVNLEDPLVQSFPELGQINETTLDLDLAEQYIQFGSYDAARQLLAVNSNKFSTEQQHRAEQLRNQIAS